MIHNKRRGSMARQKPPMRPLVAAFMPKTSDGAVKRQYKASPLKQWRRK